MGKIDSQLDLTTSRLHLREVIPSDIAPLYAFQQNEEFRRYDEDDVLNYETFTSIMTDIISQQTQTPREHYYMTITRLHNTGTVVGSAYIAIRDFQHRQAEIGYVIGREYWGHGYASEAGHAIMDFAFDVLDIHRVYAECNSENQGSIRVLEKLGMRREAHLQHTQFFRGRWWDTLIFGILKHHWPNKNTG